MFGSNLFVLPYGSDSENVSDIYVVLMIKVFYMVIMGDHHWGVYSRRAEQNTHNIHISVNKLCEAAKILMRAVYILLTKGCS